METKKSKTVWKVLGLFLILMLITGVIYPLIVTGVSQVAFKEKANGSIIEVDGKKYGSVLLAQQFTGDEYLWGRVMNLDTTTYTNDNGDTVMYAGPTNLTPASDDYEALIAERVEKLKEANPEKADEEIPIDLVTVSGSGLDPHISPEAAKYQVERVADARGMEPEEVQKIIDKYTDGKFLGILGEKTVNVLKVNLELSGILK